MMYKAPINEYMRIVKRWAGDHPEYDINTMEQVIKAVAKFCEEALEPTNEKGDSEGVKYNAKTHAVKIPACFKKVYNDICQNGYTSLALSSEYGGGDGPWVLHHIVAEMLASSNISLTTCPMLTNGAIETLIQNGSDEIKELYLNKMAKGEFTGTMCLTEPQCGTDLGLIQTIAKPSKGHYKLSGTKIWITFGEHDLSENIIHLVLAKTPGAPEGTKGISMFAVPKFLPDGRKNSVSCGGLEEKMGQHGSPTAVLNFEEAEAWLVGDEHSGMKAMFQMMNPARIGVGVQGLALSEAAWQYAYEFARNRRQSRSLDPKKQDKDAVADKILVHPDIRRMLMAIEVTNLAMRRLVAFTSHHLDQKHEDIVGLLTPIIKSYVTEKSVDNISLAMQIMGGLGYVKDGRCEQLYRDGRITMIYEGTNGIQALDLIGRKIAKDGGKTLVSFINSCKGGDKRLRKLLDEANAYLLSNAQKPEVVAAIAPSYLILLATFVQEWLLAKDDDLDPGLHLFYKEYILPEAEMHLLRIKGGGSAYINYQGYDKE